MSISDPIARLLANLMYAGAWLLGRLPLSLQRRLGELVGWASRVLNLRESRIARRNLELLRPQQSPAEREAQVRAILAHAGRTMVETLRIWTRPRADNLALVERVDNEALLREALASGRGVIIAAPHFGNWELLVEFLASQAEFTLVFRVPEKRAGELFLRRARNGPGVVLVPAEANAMRPLVKALKSGGMIGVTPDQQPKLGGGEFAPFFGRNALTLSLIPKLAEKTGARVLMAYAERSPRGFVVRFEAAPEAIADAHLGTALTAMNAAVQAIAERDFAQYQWTYKRYSKRPRGSGETNPYKPDCY
jgi:KDO2-lipid IV(A) lauroyltransferase